MNDVLSIFKVGYYLQQPVSEFLAPSIQSGGPRTTPSGYPGGPVVPPGHVSPKLARRGMPLPHQQQQHPTPSPYSSDNVIRNTNVTSSPHASPAQGPMTFTRALEVTDKLQMRGGGRGGPPLPHPQQGQQQQQQQAPSEGGAEGNRESLYDVNYEISVWHNAA